MARKLTRRQLEKLAEGFEPKIRRAFLAAFEDVRNQAGVNAMAELIRIGRVDALTEALGINSARFAPLAEAVRSVFAEGGRLAALEIPPLVSNAPLLQGQWRAPASEAMKVHFSFDIRAAGAEQWLQQHSANLVTEIINSQRDAIRTTIAEGMAMGRAPRQTALDIVGRVGTTGRRTGGVVGLTSQQAQYVANARAELLSGDPAQMSRYFSRARRDKRFDAAVRKAIKEGRPLSAADVDKITGRYADRLLALRGETIARTESITSMNAAREESYRQAIEAGDLLPENVIGTWGATGDRKTRDTHQAMNGQERRFGEPFLSPSGAMLRYPGDTSLGAGADEIANCRCTKIFRIDNKAEGARGR